MPGRNGSAGGSGGARGLPGMPLEFDDPDEEEIPRSKRARFSRQEPRGPWWRPRSRAGRVMLAAGAVAALGGLLLTGLALKRYLERDSRFRIGGTSNIEATGLVEVSRGQMLPVFGEDVGRNIFFVPLAERRKQLEELAWVKSATVMRLLPDQIRVAVVERKPVAFTRHGSEVGLVDAEGVLLSMPAATMAKHHYSFPVLTGIDARNSAEARRTRLAVYLRLMTELDSGGQRNSEQLSEIDLTDPEDARVTMPEPGGDILAHFGEDHFLERYQRYKSHIAEWRQQYPRLSAVDLRYEEQAVLQMASGSEAAAATPEAGESRAEHPAGGSAKEKPRAAAPAAKPKTPAVKNSAKAAGRKPVASAASKKAPAQQKRAETRKAATAASRIKDNSKQTPPAPKAQRAAILQGG